MDNLTRRIPKSEDKITVVSESRSRWDRFLDALVGRKSPDDKRNDRSNWKPMSDGDIENRYGDYLDKAFIGFDKAKKTVIVGLTNGDPYWIRAADQAVDKYKKEAEKSVDKPRSLMSTLVAAFSPSQIKKDFQLSAKILKVAGSAVVSREEMNRIMSLAPEDRERELDKKIAERNEERQSNDALSVDDENYINGNLFALNLRCPVCRYYPVKVSNPWRNVCPKCRRELRVVAKEFDRGRELGFALDLLVGAPKPKQSFWLDYFIYPRPDD